MARPLDVLCVGEALVDFLPDRRGVDLAAVERWERHLGGAPANVAVGLARLGARVALLGVVGADGFGRYLRDALAAEGIDARLRETREAKSGLVFISLDERGERSFLQFRHPSADLLLEPADAEGVDLAATAILHFSINALVRPAARALLRLLVARARAAGCLVACDPNPRPAFWDGCPGCGGRAGLAEVLTELVPACDVVKIAADEAEVVAGVADPEAAARALAARGALAVVTLGAGGALWARDGEVRRVAAPVVPVVDATGAGDGFQAGLLARLARALRAGRRPAALAPAELDEAVGFACWVGAEVVRTLGATAGLPRLNAFPEERS